MSKIKGKNTKPEVILRSQLFRQGIRFRIHQKNLPGKPDIVLPKYQTVIFVHGCFWHYHQDCTEGKIPSTNSNFWKEKLLRNIERDKANIKLLRKSNWRPLVVWECGIEKHLDRTVKRLVLRLKRGY